MLRVYRLRSREGIRGASGRLTAKSDALPRSQDPSTPQCSPGMTPSMRRSHPHVSFFLPGLPAQGRRAVLPSGSRLSPGRLGSEPGAAHLFLPASAEGKRARQARARLYFEFHLVGRSSLARFLFTSGWLSRRNLGWPPRAACHLVSPATQGSLSPGEENRARATAAHKGSNGSPG